MIRFVCSLSLTLFCIALSCSAILLTTESRAVAEGTPSAKSIGVALQPVLLGKASQGEVAKVAELVRGLGTPEERANGLKPLYDDDVVLFVIEAKKGIPVVSAKIGGMDYELPMARLGKSNIWATEYRTVGGEPGLPTGIVLDWKYTLDDMPLGAGHMETYQRAPEDAADPSVPKGKLTQQPKWRSTIFPDTQRDWWVYVPAQYTPDKPACVMIFQDGAGYTSLVSTVFDNLIAKGDMPVTVGIFINPGAAIPGGPPKGNERSFEYDTLSDQYARFLLEEILPEVEKTVKLKHDAGSRAVAGLSSGGICAFTAAWERPNEFSKVLSWIGSFTNIASGPTVRAGGHNYEAMIRKTPPKPIRVFLQDGRGDLDNNNGNWPLANQTLAKSLAFARYDYKFIFGYGSHSPQHGQAMLPNSLRWLWRDYPK